MDLLTARFLVGGSTASPPSNAVALEKSATPVRPRWKQPTWESQISGPMLFQDAPERVLRLSANGLIPPASPPRRTGERARNRASIPSFAAPESTTGISHCSSEPTLAKE